MAQCGRMRACISRAGLFKHCRVSPRNACRFLSLCSKAGSDCSDAELQSAVDAFVNEELAHLKLALDSKELEIQMAGEGMRHLEQCQAELQGQVQVRAALYFAGPWPLLL